MTEEYRDRFDRNLYTRMEWAAYKARVDGLVKLGNPLHRAEAWSLWPGSNTE